MMPLDGAKVNGPPVFSIPYTGTLHLTSFEELNSARSQIGGLTLVFDKTRRKIDTIVSLQ